MTRHAVTCCVVLALVFTGSCFPVREDNAMPAKLPVRRSPRSASPGAYRHIDVADTFSAAFSESNHGMASSSSSSKASALSLRLGYRYPSLGSLFSNSKIFEIHPYHRRKYTGHQSKPDSQTDYDDHVTATQGSAEEMSHQHQHITHYPQKMFLYGRRTTTQAYPEEDHSQHPSTTHTPTIGHRYETTTTISMATSPQTTTPQPPKPSHDYPIDPRIPSTAEFGDFQVFTDHPKNGAPEDQTAITQFPMEGYTSENINQDPGYTITSYSQGEVAGGDFKPITSVDGANSDSKEEISHKDFPTEGYHGIHTKDINQGPISSSTPYSSQGEVSVDDSEPTTMGTNLNSEEEDYHEVHHITHESDEDEEQTKKSNLSLSLSEEEPENEFLLSTWYSDHEEDYPSSGEVLLGADIVK